MPSTVIKSFSYDEATQILQITFVSGLVYDYLDVPPNIYHTMKQSTSKGIYFNRNIKDKFSFVKHAA